MSPPGSRPIARHPILGKRARSSDCVQWNWTGFLHCFEVEKLCAKEIFFAVSACSGSSRTLDSKENEDRYDIGRVPACRSESRKEAADGLRDSFFAGVYDGHGGSGASQFIKDNLKDVFFKNYLEADGTKKTEKILSDSFLEVDSMLYADILKAKSECQKTKEKDCKCRFYRENPCSCLNARHDAKAGSTATVVVLKSNKLYVANVGDSEAKLFSFRSYKHRVSRIVSTVTEEHSKSALHLELRSLLKIQKLKKEGTTTRISELQQKIIKNFLSMINSEVLTVDRSHSCTDLTKAHVPDTSLSDDFLRIFAVACQRRIKSESKGSVNGFYGGIRKYTSVQANYVTFPGAHALNMTRAFGNFGHKKFELIAHTGKYCLNTRESPVIATPSVKVIDLKETKEDCFLVIGSDGLWDNLRQNDVYKITMSVVKSFICHEWNAVRMDRRYARASLKEQARILLVRLAARVSNRILQAAVNAKLKEDDITVIVVLFSGIISPCL